MARPAIPGKGQRQTPTFDAEVKRGIDFQGVLNDGVDAILDALDASDGQIEDMVGSVLRRPQQIFPAKRLKEINADSVQAAFKAMEKFGQEVGREEAAYLFERFGGEKEGMKALTEGEIAEAVSAVKFVGKTVTEHRGEFRTFRYDLLKDELGTIKNAATAGAQFNARMDLKSLKLADDAMEAIVRTYIPAVREAIRQRFYRRNPKSRLVSYWSAILDNRTTLICINNDGATRRIGDKEWSNGYRGAYPAHWGERSLILNLTEDEIKALKKANEELEKKAEEEKAAKGEEGKPKEAAKPAKQKAGKKKGKRESAKAKKKREAEKGSRKTAADRWFATLSEAEQKRMLGQRYFDLWKKGKISLSEFISSRGRKLTLSELARRHPGAARKAGVA